MKRATVLVVEDNAITRKVLKVALVAGGYGVVVAPDGHSAVEQLASGKINLVLQDLVLPDCDGFELVSRLRSVAAKRAGLPILALTGLTDSQRLLSAGFDEILLKPLEPSRVVEAVDRRLGVVRARRPPSVPDEQERTHESPSIRTWSELSAILTQVGEAAQRPYTVEDVVGDVLAGFLHAAGYPIGAAFTFDAADKLSLRACCGLSPIREAEMSSSWGALPLLHEAAADGHARGFRATDADPSARALFAVVGDGSAIVLPLRVGPEKVGVMVFASNNSELDGHWLSVVGAMAGPVTQAIVLVKTISQLKAASARFQAMVESTMNGIIITDSCGVLTYVNAAAERMVARKAANAIGQGVGPMLPFMSEQCETAMGSLVAADGSEIPVEVSVRRLADGSDETQWMYVVNDLSNRRLLDEMTHRANHDVLTDLYNRRAFEEELSRHVRESVRYGVESSLLLIDLDRFKLVNDKYGHQTGDNLLKAVAQGLRATLRDCDVAARLGGDEFVVLLPHTDAVGALGCASRILKCLGEQQVKADTAVLSIGASIGIASFPRHGETSEAVFAAADQALYAAKRSGRNCARIVAPPEPLAAVASERPGAPSLRAIAGYLDGVADAVATFSSKPSQDVTRQLVRTEPPANANSSQGEALASDLEDEGSLTDIPGAVELARDDSRNHRPIEGNERLSDPWLGDDERESGVQMRVLDSTTGLGEQTDARNTRDLPAAAVPLKRTMLVG